MEITDIVFSTVGPGNFDVFCRGCEVDWRKLVLPAAGAIIVEWNVREPDGVQAGAGMWDTHFRYAFSTNLTGWSQNMFYFL